MTAPHVTGLELRYALSDALLFADLPGGVPILDGVHLEADGETLTVVATDRYALAVVRIACTAPAFELDLDRRDTTELVGILRGRHRRGVDLGVDLEPEAAAEGGSSSLVVRVGELALRYRSQPGAFPWWRGLVDTIDAKDRTPVPLVAFSARLLARLGKVTNTTGEPVRLHPGGTGQPLDARFGDRVRVLLMPVRLAEVDA